MKKQLIFLTTLIASFGLMAFGCANFSGPADEKVDFQFNIDSREFGKVTKEALLNAATVGEFIPANTNWPKHSITSLMVTVFKDHHGSVEQGSNLTLTDDQKKLLHSLEYDEIFRVDAKCQGPNPDDPSMTEYDMYYAFTVVPEKEASFPGGMESVIDYLKNNCKKEISKARADVLDPGLIVFTVNKDGSVSKSEHLISSGYPNLDNKLVELMKNLPQNWTPAENANGEKVPQELALRFGDLSGC